MITYENALVNQEKAGRAYAKASVKLQEANKVLEEAKRNLTIECTCHHHTKVSDIELIVQKSGGYQSFDNYDPDWIYHTSTYWVCPKCQTPQAAPDSKGPFIRGFENYVNKVHEWYSDRERCHGRVLELLSTNFDREAEREKGR